MLTSEANERLTQVGVGTPVGDLLRRYWHVVAGREQLEREPVLPIRLLDETRICTTLFSPSSTAGLA